MDNLSNFNKLIRTDMAYDNNKSQKTRHFHSFSPFFSNIHLFKMVKFGRSNFIEILESFNSLKNLNSVGNSVELYAE